MWYVIWATAQNEYNLKEKIEKNVSKEEYRDIWIPVKDELRKYKGEEIIKRVKLFPGYLFIDTDSPDVIQEKLNREKEFIKILGSDDVYEPISEAEEEIIRHFSGKESSAGVSIGVIKKGVLTILDGPLKGLEDKVVRIERHRKKAWVHFDKLLGSSRDLSFCLNIVEKE